MSQEAQANARSLMERGRALLNAGPNVGRPALMEWFSDMNTFYFTDGPTVDNVNRPMFDALSAIYDALNIAQAGQNPRTGGFFQKAFEWVESNVPLASSLSTQVMRVGEAIDPTSDKPTSWWKKIGRLGQIAVIAFGIFGAAYGANLFLRVKGK